MSTFLAIVALGVMALSLYKQSQQPKAVRIDVRDEGADLRARRRR